MEEVCENIKKSIKKSYRDFGRIYQPGCCPTAEVIYGVKIDGESKLFYANGPAINENPSYASGGVGRIMVEFSCDTHGGI